MKKYLVAFDYKKPDGTVGVGNVSYSNVSAVTEEWVRHVETEVREKNRYEWVVVKNIIPLES